MNDPWVLALSTSGLPFILGMFVPLILFYLLFIVGRAANFLAKGGYLTSLANRPLGARLAYQQFSIPFGNDLFPAH